MPKVGTLAGLNIGRKKIKFSKIKAKVKDSGEDEVRFSQMVGPGISGGFFKSLKI